MKKTIKSSIKENKRPLITILLFVFAVIAFSFGQNLFAGVNDNVYNGISNPVNPEDTATWGPNFGWVSVNSHNSAGDCVPAANNCVEYGVQFDSDENSSTFGYLTGQMWAGAENLGWITFDETVVGLYEGADVCGSQAQLDASGTLFTGWARAIVAPTGQNDYWNGCISLSGSIPSGGSYGVNYDPNTGDITGQAWGGELIGWLNFAAHTDPENTILPPDAPIVTFDTTLSPIATGEFDILEWSIQNATCNPLSVNPNPNNGSDWLGQVTLASGTFNTGPLTANTTYELECTGDDGSYTVRQAIVYVGGVEFYASPASVNAGESTTLIWNTEGMQSCEADGSSPYSDTQNWPTGGALSANGSQSTMQFDETHVGTMMYEIMCDPIDPSLPEVSATAEVEITLGDIHLQATPSTVAQLNQNGEYFTSLSWQIEQNYDSCTLYRDDSTGITAVQGFNPIPGNYPLAPSWSFIGQSGILVPEDPTTFFIECTGPANTSNDVTLTHEEIEPSVVLDAPGCVPPGTPSTWLAVMTENVDTATCVFTGPAPIGGLILGDLTPDNDFIFPQVTPASYEITCQHPVSGEPDLVDDVFISTVDQNCAPPPPPPGTPDPDIIFEEF
jgi:hypothetical protein